MGLVFFHRWGLLDTRRRGYEGGFCHSQWTAFAAWARSMEVTGRSAVGAEASDPALLVDALPLGVFLAAERSMGAGPR